MLEIGVTVRDGDELPVDSGSSISHPHHLTRCDFEGHRPDGPHARARQLHQNLQHTLYL